MANVVVYGWSATSAEDEMVESEQKYRKTYLIVSDGLLLMYVFKKEVDYPYYPIIYPHTLYFTN